MGLKLILAVTVHKTRVSPRIESRRIGAFRTPELCTKSQSSRARASFSDNPNRINMSRLVRKSHARTTFRICSCVNNLPKINGVGEDRLRTTTRFWIGTAVTLTLAQVLGSMFLPRGYALTAISDFALALLLLALAVVFAKNAIPTRGRLRAFWVMQSIGWFMLVLDQLGWMLYDLVWQKPVPTPFALDVLLYLPGVLMLAGFLLQPHLEQSKRSARLGTLDFLLLMLWWVFFYVYLVTCWQYVSPNVDMYNRNYDWLYMAEILVVLIVLCELLKRSTGAWRRFYAFYLVAVLFSYFSFTLV